MDGGVTRHTAARPLPNSHPSQRNTQETEDFDPKRGRISDITQQTARFEHAVVGFEVIEDVRDGRVRAALGHC